uniref:Phage protein n=1 Tax=Pseudomonas phage Cygsa01 TaxID=3138529 RepID=A0AAU6W3S1_9VIRU
MKIKFKPDTEQVQDNTRLKAWDIIVDGKVVGGIDTCIRDLFMSRTTPGYSVTVTAVIIGKEKSFREYSAAFSNRSSEEAHGNRAEYVRRAKAWATKHFERSTAS